MSNTAANVTAGKPETTGAIYTALVSASPTIPDDTDDSLSSFECVGYISEDGVKRAQEISSESIKAWGGDVVLRTRTGKDTTFTFKMIEYLNTVVQKVVYGDGNVSGDISTGITIEDVPSFEGEERVWVIDQIMTGDVKCRMVIPCAVVTAVSEVTYADAEAAGYEVTIGALPDSAGTTVYEYLKEST